VQALERYWQRLYDVYGNTTIERVAALSTMEPPIELQALASHKVDSQEAWFSAVTEALPVEEA